MVEEFGGRADFRIENYGNSKLAKKFHITRYPAVFVNDTLIATPSDFGFYGKDAPKNDGLYAPLRAEMSHIKFRSDLKQAIERALTGKKPSS